MKTALSFGAITAALLKLGHPAGVDLVGRPLPDAAGCFTGPADCRAAAAALAQKFDVEALIAAGFCRRLRDEELQSIAAHHQLGGAGAVHLPPAVVRRLDDPDGGLDDEFDGDFDGDLDDRDDDLDDGLDAVRAAGPDDLDAPASAAFADPATRDLVLTERFCQSAGLQLALRRAAGDEAFAIASEQAWTRGIDESWLRLLEDFRVAEQLKRSQWGLLLTPCWRQAVALLNSGWSAAPLWGVAQTDRESIAQLAPALKQLAERAAPRPDKPVTPIRLILLEGLAAPWPAREQERLERFALQLSTYERLKPGLMPEVAVWAPAPSERYLIGQAVQFGDRQVLNSTFGTSLDNSLFALHRYVAGTHLADRPPQNLYEARCRLEKALQQGGPDLQALQERYLHFVEKQITRRGYDYASELRVPLATGLAMAAADLLTQSVTMAPMLQHQLAESVLKGGKVSADLEAISKHYHRTLNQLIRMTASVVKIHRRT